MSQFAAQQQAGNPAPPRQGGLAEPPIDPVPRKGKRGTALAFRLLKQRLIDSSASLPRLADLPSHPAPGPIETAIDPIQPPIQPEIEQTVPAGEETEPTPVEIPQTPVDAGDPSKIDPITPAFQADGKIADIEAFDLTGLLDPSQTNYRVEIDLS